METLKPIIMHTYDIINQQTGKSRKEENLEKGHKHSIDSLVEFNEEANDQYIGMQLYIIALIRDCDGTPLNLLGYMGQEPYQDKRCKFYTSGTIKASDEVLTLIKTGTRSQN